MNVDAAAQRLRAAGHKITPQRTAILRYLEGNTTHPCAERIHRDLLAEHPALAFTTVYRTLEVLVRLGEVLELSVGGDRKHYDPNVECRVHVICPSCRRIEDVMDPEAAAPEAPAWVREAYRLSEAHVQFYGLCAACRAADRCSK